MKSVSQSQVYSIDAVYRSDLRQHRTIFNIKLVASTPTPQKIPCQLALHFDNLIKKYRFQHDGLISVQ